MKRTYFKGLDMMKPTAVEITKMPRASSSPISYDPVTKNFNAGIYSCGVISLNPYRIVFGIQNPTSMRVFENTKRFTVAFPSKEQVDQLWVLAFIAPRGVNELELANFTQIPSEFSPTPLVKEVPLNLECEMVSFIQLPPPLRAIGIAEVKGFAVDKKYVEMPRNESAHCYPMHEGGMRIEDGGYGSSIMSNEMYPAALPGEAWTGKVDEYGKVHLMGDEMYAPENRAALAAAVIDRPCYMVITVDEDGSPRYEKMKVGFAQSLEPAVYLPITKDGETLKNIQRDKRFVLAVPTRENLENFDRLGTDSSTDFETVNLHILEPNMGNIPGIDECPVNMDCVVNHIEIIEDQGMALVIGTKVGCSIPAELDEKLDQIKNPPHVNMEAINDFYSRMIYKVLDRDGTEKSIFYDKYGTVPLKSLPTWGGRYDGGWWGMGTYADAFRLNYWLIELCQEKLLSKREFRRIMNYLKMYGNGEGPVHLKEFFTDEMRKEMQTKLTELFKLMVWAHRDMWKWDRVHAYLETLPDPYLYKGHHDGPLYFEAWSADDYM